MILIPSYIYERYPGKLSKSLKRPKPSTENYLKLKTKEVGDRRFSYGRLSAKHSKQGKVSM